MKDKALFNAAANWNIHVVTVLLDRVVYMPDVLTQTIFRAAYSKPMDKGTGEIPCKVDNAINQERLVKRLLKARVGPDIAWETTKTKRPLIHYAADGINLVRGLRALLSKGKPGEYCSLTLQVRILTYRTIQIEGLHFTT